MPWLIERSDGGVSILRVKPTHDPAVEIEKFRGALEARNQTPKSLGLIVRVEEITENDIPSDRSLRPAWVAKPGKVEVDLAKGKVAALALLNQKAQVKMTKASRDLLNDEAAVATERGRLGGIVRGAAFGNAPNVTALMAALNAELAKL